MMASRERKDREVVVADSQRPAWTGILPYGVAGEIAANRDVSSELKKEKKKKISKNETSEQDVQTNVLIHPEPFL